METTNSDNMSQETPETKCFKRKSLLGLIVLGSSIFLAGCTLSLLAPFYTKARRIRRREKPFLALKGYGYIMSIFGYLNIASSEFCSDQLKIRTSILF